MAGEADKPSAESIFLAVLDLPPGERPAYLARVSGDNHQLRQRVEALIRAHEAPKGFLPEQPGAPAAGSAIPATLLTSMTEQPGDSIGSYKLLQKLGEGGCGVVYMAEQEEPVRRRVALKVIKLGMDTRQVVARFEAERQALALMDHPNIARVLEAGATETGRPYFVMELVGGVKITDYCEQNHLDTRQRLDLFMQVCRAIQHAHQKGVIHRDIKPSNVLVATQDGVGVPKVIDFGIAKATQGRLTDQTIFTAFEQFLGTPAYMSPEQAQLGGLDVDTRSDIYSLGVLLYELLTGTTPFDTKELVAAGLDEMRRTIREVEPVKPSTRLTRGLAAQARDSAKSKIKNQKSKIANDLDWIVMKCLEKDRARRYDTANGLARDIERHLANEPVVARPPSRLYEFQKTVRRHKFGFAAVAGIIVVLAVGAIASTLEAVRAVRAEREQSHLRQMAQTAQAGEVRQREKAQTEAAKSRQVAQFLTDMLQGVGPSVARGQDTKMLREILDKTAQRATNDLHEQPDVEAELVSIIGGVYKELGEDAKAERMFSEAIAIHRKHFGEEDPGLAESLAHLCYTQWRQSYKDKKAEAEKSGREAVALYRKLKAKTPQIYDLKLAFALDQLANTVHRIKTPARPAEAEEAAREALALTGSDPTSARAYALQVLALVIGNDRPAEAETLLREALEIRLAADESENVWRLVFLTHALEAQGKFEEAENVIGKGIAFAKQSNNLDVLVASLGTLGQLLRQEGKLEDARIAFREALDITRKTFGDGHQRYGAALMDLGDTFLQEGKIGESVNLYSEALAVERRLPNGDLARFIRPRVRALMEDDKPEAVEQLFNAWNSPSFTNNEAELVIRARGDFFASRSRWDEAAADFTRALELRPNTLNLQRLIAALIQSGNFDTYRDRRQRAIDQWRNTTNCLTAQRVGIICLVLPPSGAASEAVNAMADAVMRADTNASSSVPLLLIKSLAEYRQGHFANAAEWSERALARPLGTNSVWVGVQIYAVQAMARWQLQQTNAAQASLATALELARAQSSKSSGDDFGPRLTDRVFAETLLRESQALIESQLGTEATAK